MLRIAFAVLSLALAGTASAAGWRSLSLDGSSEASFSASVAALQAKLPQVRRLVFEKALQDIWAEGTKAAAASGNEYTLDEYHRQLDGLGYKEVVTFTDPSGTAARRSYNAYYRSVASAGPARPPPANFPPPREFPSSGPANPNRY